jgi:hypothetical protein
MGRESFENQIAAKQKKRGAGRDSREPRCLLAESLVDLPTHKDSAGGYEKRLNSDCAKHSGDRQAKRPKQKPDCDFVRRDAKSGQDDRAQGVQRKALCSVLGVPRLTEGVETNRKQDQAAEVRCRRFEPKSDDPANYYSDQWHCGFKNGEE